MNRVRTLYQKLLQTFSSNSQAWCDFASMEIGLQEFERAKAILELAVSQPVLDSPELVWKYVIVFLYFFFFLSLIFFCKVLH